MYFFCRKAVTETCRFSKALLKIPSSVAWQAVKLRHVVYPFDCSTHHIHPSYFACGDGRKYDHFTSWLRNWELAAGYVIVYDDTITNNAKQNEAESQDQHVPSSNSTT